MRIFLGAILVFLLGGATCFAQSAATQPAATEPGNSIAALIAQLSDPVFSVRQNAEKALTDLGPTIEPQLRDAQRQNLPDETRARLQAIIARFDEAISLHASVTLHYKDAPLA